MAILTGLGPNEISTNADLGTLAHQDHDNVHLTNGLAALDEYQKAYSAPKIKPTLNLPFSKMLSFDPRVTFTRSSDAMVYEGDSQKAEENLLKYSEQFDNTSVWQTAGATTVANQAIAPNGTNTAEVWTVTSQFGRITQLSVGSQPAGTYTFSIWLRRDAGTNPISFGTNATASVGSFLPTNVWQRFSFTGSFLAFSTFTVVQDREVDGFTPVEVWGAQLEQRDFLTDYQRTTDRIIQKYVDIYSTVPSNTPRFKEIDPVTKERKGLLVEETRTNLVLYSDDFTNAVWTPENTTKAVGVPSPVGPGFKLVENTANAQHSVVTSITTVTGTTYTLSLFVKVEPSFVGDTYLLRLTVGGLSVDVNVFEGTQYENDWYRVSFTFVADRDANFIRISLRQKGVVYTGDGYSGIYISQAQLEVGSFATSPILTLASQVTRAVESGTISSINDIYNLAEGSLYLAISDAYLRNGVTNFVIGFFGGSNQAFAFTSVSRDIRPIYSSKTSFDTVLGADGFYSSKLAISADREKLIYKRDSLSIEQTITTENVLAPNPTNFSISTVTSKFFVDGIQYYPQALNADELAFLTRNTNE